MTPVPGHLADNVVHFARVLRRAGLPIGTDRVLLGLRALEVAGLHSRDDLHAVLAACLIDRRDHLALFDQAFEVFWRDPDLLGSLLRALPPGLGDPEAATLPPANRRLIEALLGGGEGEAPAAPPLPFERDAQLSWSERERLGKADFDAMTTREWEQARRLVDQLRPLFPRLATRRSTPSARGAAIDLRALLRAAARHGGDFVALPRRRRRRRPAPLVAIVDISGSMSRYSRMFLHFLHAISSADHRVTAFVFGTRLTPISRPLRAKDPDLAIAAVVRAVEDWSGGTRIGDTLHAFNRDWARRVLAPGATVLLVSDGLEQGSAEALGRETERLAKSCRRLIWLNPLLRYDGFEPKARGVRAILPFVDALVPMHNVDSLGSLARALAGGAALYDSAPLRAPAPQ